METAAPAARPAYRVLGTTTDVTECEHCGRTDLKGTVRLAPLDEDGNPDGDAVYFGMTCGARAAGWTLPEIRTRATAADRAAREAAHQARMAAAREESAAADALRGTADCPTGPSICRRSRIGCIAHGNA